MKNPAISSSAFVADNATVRGDVTLGERSSVFFGAVLRGDRAPITIGSGTNIQEVNRLIKQFDQTRKMMKLVTGTNMAKMAGMMSKMKGMPGMPKM